MTTGVVEDGPLPIARARLENAVAALADPSPQWFNGACFWAPSVYQRLRVALSGGRVLAGRVYCRPAPLRVDVLEWLIDVDGSVARWEPEGKSTIERLGQLVARGWRPQDVSLMDDRSGRIERWLIEAAELLGDAGPKVSLRVPCPSCGERWAYRGDDRVRVAALRVDESGCRCLACRAVWPPEEFGWLAKLIEAAASTP